MSLSKKPFITLGTTLALTGVLAVTAEEKVEASTWTARTVDEIRADIEATEGGFKAYEIKWGDTLGAIALALDIPLENIVEINAINNVDLITVGETLQISGDAETVSVEDTDGDVTVYDLETAEEISSTETNEVAVEEDFATVDEAVAVAVVDDETATAEAEEAVVEDSVVEETSEAAEADSNTNLEAEIIAASEELVEAEPVAPVVEETAVEEEPAVKAVVEVVEADLPQEEVQVEEAAPVAEEVVEETAPVAEETANDASDPVAEAESHVEAEVVTETPAVEEAETYVEPEVVETEVVEATPVVAETPAPQPAPAPAPAPAPKAEPKPEPAPAPAPVASGNVISIGEQYMGTPYVWAGTSPSGFDCSGFTQYVFGKTGKYIPRTAQAQYNASTKVSNPQPGDLVFFSHGGGGVDHVGIYTGGGSFLGAQSSTGVAYSSTSNSYWGPRVVGYGRY